jgi:lipid-binding SYLF domain-containing protein
MEDTTMKTNRWLAYVWMFAGVTGFAAAVSAETPPEIDAGAAAVLHEFYAARPEHHQLADKAAAMLVFPRVTKAGVGIGGSYGEGVLLVHGRTVGYYKVGSASVGATLGVATQSEVIMFMTDDARDRFLRSRGWTVGADAAVAVLSIGAGGHYDSELLHKPVLGFVFGEKGLMGDLSLEGSKITRIGA